MGEILFWFQMVIAFVYTLPMIHNIMHGKVEGLTQAMYVIFMAYLALGFSLSLSSYRESKSRIRLQTIIIFANWLVLVGTLVVVGFSAIPWRSADTIFTAVIATIAVATVVWYRGVTDPMARGWIAVWCKALPQLWLAYTMLFVAHSSNGFDGLSLIAGHCTGIARLLQIVLSCRKGGWDRPTRGLLLGEVANVTTWGVVTVVWLILR